MTLPLSKLVPDEYDRWYYHEPTGLLLRNNFEYGWCAVANMDSVQTELDELTEALDEMGGDFTHPDGVLPLSDDYEP